MQPQQGAGSAGLQRADAADVLGAMAAATTRQVADQRQSARLYGLGECAATRLSQSLQKPWQHLSAPVVVTAPLVWTKPGKESEPLPLSSSGFAPLLAVAPLLADGQPQLRVAANASSCA
jgi:hypothetical protein